MTDRYSISELAKEFDVTTRTIRHYEDQGLLTPQREGTSRWFANRDRVRLKLALRGKRLGFSLAEIRELFDLYDSANGDEQHQLQEFLSKLRRHRDLLQRKREDIDIMLGEIDFFERQCSRMLTDEISIAKTAA